MKIKHGDLVSLACSLPNRDSGHEVISALEVNGELHIHTKRYGWTRATSPFFRVKTLANRIKALRKELARLESL